MVASSTLRPKGKVSYTEGSEEDDTEVIYISDGNRSDSDERHTLPETRAKRSHKQENEDIIPPTVSRRTLSKPRPSYKEDDDNDSDSIFNEENEMQEDDKGAHKESSEEEACPVCGKGGEVLCCDGCPNTYHLTCLDPPLAKVPSGYWYCPKCTNPLAEIEKFLDSRKHVDSGKGEETTEYLVKFRSKSYMHCSWIKDKEILEAAQSNSGLKAKLRNFQQRGPPHLMDLDDDFIDGEDIPAIRPEWLLVDKIISTRKQNSSKQYLVKWKELGYEAATWEEESDLKDFASEIQKFHRIESRANRQKRLRKEDTAVRRKRNDFTETPSFLTGGSLHDYQLEGLNWLRFAWQKKKHVILADEMGLGKTIQSIAFLAAVNEEEARFPGSLKCPSLVVAPLSTLRNWEREFELWAPHLNVIMYAGSGADRKVAQKYEFYAAAGEAKHGRKRDKKKRKSEAGSGGSSDKQWRVKFDVLLTSYEMILVDTAVLRGFKWECLIVDEGHRLKNKESKLFQTLTLFRTNHRILLTGTPLQNNLDELFMLMHFLDSSKFKSLEEFQSEFRDLSQEEQVGSLHRMLAPHLLRRLKKDVLKDMPPKKELIVRVDMSSLQRTLYKAILTRNYHALTRHFAKNLSLLNVVMQLRKLCGHPYLIDGTEPAASSDRDQDIRNMVEASGKLSLLEKMMTVLKAEGHRVLIYSQFKRVLDILEDWLAAKNWGYERIDGEVSGSERQARIDRFNAPASSRFCFLLSTRAGGLGINLATADTVFIYDSDWNPHADLQAMARAHRLGQKGTVLIYRLITRGTIEERMMQMTKKKMVLEHVVVGRMKSSANLNQSELDDILRFGARELFEAEEQESAQEKRIQYDDAAIKLLLDRSQAQHGEERVEEQEESEYLKAFKVANFEFVEESGPEQGPDADPDSKLKGAVYWDQLLKGRVEQQEELAEEMGKGKRHRKHVNYKLPDDDPLSQREVHSDPDVVLSEDGESSSDSEGPAPLQVAEEPPPVPEKAPKRPKPGPHPLMEGSGKDLHVLGFSAKQRGVFLSLVLRFGLGDLSWSEYQFRLGRKSLQEVQEYAALFLTHLCAPDSPGDLHFSDGVPKEGLKVPEVLQRIGILHLVHEKVGYGKSNPGKPLFGVEARSLLFLGYREQLSVWGRHHDLQLLQAVVKHGYGRWQDIVSDLSLGFQGALRQELRLQPPAPYSGKLPTTFPGPKEDYMRSLIDLPGGLRVTFVQWQQEMQANRKMADFVKKRLPLLFKVLSYECHTQLKGNLLSFSMHSFPINPAKWDSLKLSIAGAVLSEANALVQEEKERQKLSETVRASLKTPARSGLAPRLDERQSLVFRRPDLDTILPPKGEKAEAQMPGISPESAAGRKSVEQGKVYVQRPFSFAGYSQPKAEEKVSGDKGESEAHASNSSLG